MERPKTNKHLLKKIARIYAGSMLVSLDATIFGTKMDNDSLYILQQLHKIGERMGGEIGGSIETISNEVLSQKHL